MSDEPTRRNGTALPAVVGLSAGMLLWGISRLMVTAREPWDSTEWWSAIYPACIVVSGGLGWFFPRRFGLAVLLVFEAQLFGMWIAAGEVGSLWPLGMILLAILGLPGLGVAKLAAIVTGRREKESSAGS